MGNEMGSSFLILFFVFFLFDDPLKELELKDCAVQHTDDSRPGPADLVSVSLLSPYIFLQLNNKGAISDCMW
jgi:hypothetical protein